MSQSNNSDDGKIRAASKTILLQRDHELSEFAALLTELGVPTLNCLSGLPGREEFASARLVIASAERLLESGPPHLSQWPRTLVVVENPSKTLTAHLSRIGATMILQQPIHPRALRLLLLHEAYLGPEKRERRRTLIGEFVRIGSGLFGTKGMLIDLSPSSARLHMAKAPKLANTLQIQLGRELTQGSPLKLKARVVRCNELPDEPGYEVGLSLIEARKNRKAIRSILDRFASGPANWKSETIGRRGAGGAAAATASSDPTPTQTSTQTPTPTSTPTPTPTQTPTPQAKPGRAPASRALPPSHAATGSESPNLGALRATAWGEVERLESDTPEIEIQDVEPTERRVQQRIAYDNRVVALDEEAARVLLGRDLSIGGMRVVSNATVAMGSLLRIALHAGAEAESLVLLGRAVRDDGPDGMLLAFEKLDPIARERLEKIIAGNGQIRETGDPDARESEVDDFLVVGELLDEIDLEDVIEDADSPLDADESIENIL